MATLKTTYVALQCACHDSGLAGGIIVTIITKIIQQPYGEMSLADYEPMPVHFTLPIPIAVIGIIIPTAIYMLEAAHKVSKLLKKDTVEMLNGNADGDSRTRHVLAGKKRQGKK